ncbi:helix-turn-helix transcriptional regulator [Nonomuraea typhae]|uniref:helix-turn-helix transcriptional regulator n=1 Tax=Nonomuraea typhae TaxID=2603600 RepID=UPI0012FC52B8|nr:LuxR C-terminal-related transcriptional regulator [Nonomuraea typhae]
MTLGTFRRRPGELPRDVTTFIGRHREQAELAALLTGERLVTVTGPGGVGKTRLSLRVADGIKAHFGDGICLIELSALRDPELLPHTACTALGLPEKAGQTQLDTLLDHLQERDILLILDTCEHLIDACAGLADILMRETPRVRVLATSRQPLDVPGEHTYMIAPLPVPDSVADVTDSGDAIELFALRAATVVPGFRLTEANAGQVVALCRRLDGMPLAIELATVRLRAVPLEQLIERLEDRFRLLTGGRRTALPRHQTLRTTIDWSHELCTPEERLLWARLSVFAGSFDLDAAEEVCADGELPAETVMETLIGLVDKSLVLRADEPGARYRQLDTIREYGADQLARSGEQEAVRGRQIARFQRLATYFDEHFIDDDQLERYRALRREHANLRAAMEHAMLLPDPTVAADLINALWGYWQISCLYTESRYWLGQVLRRCAAPSRQRARALGIRAYLIAFQGDLDTALADCAEALPMAEALGERLLAGRILLYRHLALCFAGRLGEAAATAEDALAIMEEVGDRIGLVALDAQDGYRHHLAGEPEDARRLCEHGLGRLGPGTGEQWLRGYLYYITSAALFGKGDHKGCEAAGRTAIGIKTELGDMIGTAYCLETHGWLAAARGRAERAAWLLGAADRLWRVTGLRLSGTVVMEEFHQKARTAALAEIGERLFAELAEHGARTPLETVVAATLDDADKLPGALEMLTRREREVAGLVRDGLSNREIAERLHISKRTADTHLEHILAKLGLTSRSKVAELVAGVTTRSGP